MKDKLHYENRIIDLIKLGDSLKHPQGSMFVHPDSIKDCQYWFSHVITLIQEINSLDTYFYDEAVSIIRGSKRQGGIFWQDIEMMKGFLQQFLDAVDGGLLLKIRDEITADDYHNFLDHAKHYCNIDKKIEASVIVSAVFEDSIKKMATKNGIKKIESLESSINFLKSSGIISSNEAKKYKYFAGLRNSALHAAWDEFELKDISDFINGTETIIKEYVRQ
jgi:hypothetical protein